MKDTETFLKVLDPDDTSTGGGSASAISGSMAGALIAMVCLLCEKSAEPEEKILFRDAAIRAQALSEQLLAGGREDTKAFQTVRSAFKLPKESDEEKKSRSQAIQAAWIQAARVPLENAGRCLQAAQLGMSLSERILPQVRSDLNSAIYLARAGVLGCLENVDINLPSIKDAAAAAQLAGEAAGLRAGLATLDQSPA